MLPPPSTVGDLPAVRYTVLDQGHTPTGATRHYVDGALLGPPAGLAICRADGGFYLFYCNADWEPVTDSWHATQEQAIAQAEFEFAGTATGWRAAG
jgi:hypothetical protein